MAAAALSAKSNGLGTKVADEDGCGCEFMPKTKKNRVGCITFDGFVSSSLRFLSEFAEASRIGGGTRSS